MKKTEITQERKILLGKIHIARKALGLDEETYRSVIPFGAAAGLWRNLSLKTW